MGDPKDPSPDPNHGDKGVLKPLPFTRANRGFFTKTLSLWFRVRGADRARWVQIGGACPNVRISVPGDRCDQDAVSP